VLRLPFLSRHSYSAVKLPLAPSGRLPGFGGASVGRAYPCPPLSPRSPQRHEREGDEPPLGLFPGLLFSFRSGTCDPFTRRTTPICRGFPQQLNGLYHTAASCQPPAGPFLATGAG